VREKKYLIPIAQNSTNRTAITLDIAKESFTTTFRHRDSSIQTVQGMTCLGIFGPEPFSMI
jgi:hypothetical protein